MDAPPLSAALIDVGGTLWPDQMPMTPALDAIRACALAEVLRIDEESAGSLAMAIDEDVVAASSRTVNSTIERVLSAKGMACDEELQLRIRRAMCIPLSAALRPFDGAGDLLEGAKRLGLRSVVVSNSTYRDAEMYKRDFVAQGWWGLIDAVVTSVDVGHPKPSEIIFRAALVSSDASPDQCVMIGNNERLDIVPARLLGMRTVLVAIEEPMPKVTNADLSVASLFDALTAVQSWRPD